MLEELYSYKFKPEEFIESGRTKLYREEYSVSMGCSRIVAQNSGLVETVSGKLLLTKLGVKLSEPKKRLELFYRIFLVFTQKINWSDNDLYTEDAVAQLGWAYSLYLLIKFGEEERAIDFYAEKYFRAFPDFIKFFPLKDHHTPKEMYLHSYGVAL